MSRIKNFFLEQTEGNGNCAFNAFILGFSRQSVIDNIENGFIQAGEDPDIAMRDFIQQASSSLKVQSRWAALKQEIMQLRQTSKVGLQNRIAPILRELAIHLAENDQEHQQRTIEPLLSAFNDFITLRQDKEKPPADEEKRSIVEDDIFKRHTFIQQKFSELFSKSRNSHEATSELEEWWVGSGSLESGYRQFLKAMKKEGVWAGDLELFQLARYFRVNLDVLRDDYVHRIYSHAGKVPRQYYTHEQIVQLVSRQVVNAPAARDKELAFLPLTEMEIRDRLQAVPEFDKVVWYVIENEFIKDLSTPNEWSACLKQLWIRNLIEKRNDIYIFIADREVIMQLSAEMANSENIIEIWKKFHCNVPTVTLSNPRAVHWSNVLPADEKPAESNLIVDYYKSFMSYIYDRFFLQPAQKAHAPKRVQYKFDYKFFAKNEAEIAAKPEYLGRIREEL